MNNRNVAHLWASQNREHGKGSNFYFEGPTLYSYGRHFKVAAFTQARDANGEQIVLFNSGSYSNSTGKHQSFARSALHGLNVRVIHVPDVSDAPAQYEHANNLQHFADAFASSILKASRARTNKQWHIEQAQRAQADAADYCRAFGLDMPSFLDDVVSPELLADARDLAKRNAAKNAEKERARVAMLAAEYAEKIEAWRNGASEHECELWRFAGMPTALRVRGDVIETSRGADVPLRVAARLWAAVTSARKHPDNARRLSNDMSGDAVGAYNLRQVKPDGSLVIGCHTIEFSELERMAHTLGFIPEGARA
jgi:hypothetical protein